MHDTEQAVRRLQAGDQTALPLLYNTYAESAIRTAFLITRTRATAEDAVQEAFIQILRTVHSLRNPAAFRPWFYRIVINAAKRLSRTRRLPSAQNQAPRETPSPVDTIMQAEEIEALRLAIAQLQEPHREVIILRYYSDLAEADIAQVLGIPVGTVKSRLHRAKAALHELLSLPQRGETV